MLLKTFLLLYVSVAFPEGDGSFNYLLVKPRTSISTEILIAHSYHSDMNLKEGEWIKVEVDAECQTIKQLLPIPKGMEGATPWGVPVDAILCNARSIKINDIYYHSLKR